MADTMRAVVLDAPGPVEDLQIRDLPLPEPRPRWVRIKVMAFGLNRSELDPGGGLAPSTGTPRGPAGA
jgi:NADPH:quinone reductase